MARQNHPVRSEDAVYIRTDKDTHFTGALAQNAGEAEDITGLVSSRITIEAINIQSDQNLNWELFLWAKDTKDDTDLDVDKFVDYVTFDVGDGKQIAGAGQYYYGLSNLRIPYFDEDLTKELHVTLVNRSATSKNAGATGEVVVQVMYRPDGEGAQ